MDKFEFILALSDSLAWPVTTGVTVYVLREPLRVLIEHVALSVFKRLEHRPSERRR